MGTTIRILCNNCYKTPPTEKPKFKKNDNSCISVDLGIGFMFSPHNVFFGYAEKPFIYSLIKDKKITLEVKKLLLAGATPGEDYSIDIYYCDNCKAVETKFFFSLVQNEKIYIPTYKCCFCENELRRIYNADDSDNYDDIEELQKLNILCKKCGGNDFTIDLEGYWD